MVGVGAVGVVRKGLVAGHSLVAHHSPAEAKLGLRDVGREEPGLLVEPPREGERREGRPFVPALEFARAVETPGGGEHVAVFVVVHSAGEERQGRGLGLKVGGAGVGSRRDGRCKSLILNYIPALDSLFDALAAVGGSSQHGRDVVALQLLLVLEHIVPVPVDVFDASEGSCRTLGSGVDARRLELGVVAAAPVPSYGGLESEAVKELYLGVEARGETDFLAVVHEVGQPTVGARLEVQVVLLLILVQHSCQIRPEGEYASDKGGRGGSLARALPLLGVDVGETGLGAYSKVPGDLLFDVHSGREGLESRGLHYALLVIVAEREGVRQALGAAADREMISLAHCRAERVVLPVHRGHLETGALLRVFIDVTKVAINRYARLLLRVQIVHILLEREQVHLLVAVRNINSAGEGHAGLLAVCGLGGDKNHAICSESSVNSCSRGVFQNLHTLDVLGAYAQKAVHLLVSALVIGAHGKYGLALRRAVEYDSVHYVQRFVAAMEG